MRISICGLSIWKQWVNIYNCRSECHLRSLSTVTKWSFNLVKRMHLSVHSNNLDANIYKVKKESINTELFKQFYIKLFVLNRIWRTTCCSTTCICSGNWEGHQCLFYHGSLIISSS